MAFRITLEIILGITILLVFLFWSIWFRLSTRKLRKKYEKDPDSDISKNAKDFKPEGRGELKRRKPKVENATVSSSGFSEPAERNILPPTTSGSFRKNSESNRNLFRRIKRQV